MVLWRVRILPFQIGTQPLRRGTPRLTENNESNNQVLVGCRNDLVCQPTVIPSLPLTVSFALLFLTILAVKVVLAAHLDLFPDEAFYWLESERLALSFSDVPVLTPALVRAGTWLWGDSPLAARSLFLIFGSLLPPAVYLLASTIAGRTFALHSTFFLLLLPMPAAIGLLILPDVPMVVLSVFALAAFFRATRANTLLGWIVFGVICALGVNAHYRFFFFILAAVICLFITKKGRSNWREPGLWTAVSILFAGCIPVFLFNSANDFAAVSFQFNDRHPWAFDLNGLAYVVEQLYWATPLIFLLLAITLWRCARQGMAGSDPHAMIAIFAGANILPFLVLSPWMDRGEAFTAHWPVFGYICLLAFLPETLSVLVRRLNRRARRWLAWVIPGSGLFFVMFTFLVLTLSAFYSDIPRPLRVIASDRMAGWSEVGAKVMDLRASGRWRDDAPIVTDEYYLAAEIAYTTDQQNVYALNAERARVMGRKAQLEIWDLFENGLRRNHSLANALLVVERGARELYSDAATVSRLCEVFGQIRFMDELELFDGERRYSFYSAERIRPLVSGRPLPPAELSAQPSCFEGMARPR